VTRLGGLLSAAIALILGDLVPLALVLKDQLESADVLMGLAIQVGLLAWFSGIGNGQILSRADRIGLAVLPAFLGVVIAARVSWDAGSMLGVAFTAGSTLTGRWFASLQSDHTVDDLTGGIWAMASRLALVWVGVLGLDVADRLDQLYAHGWEPSALESGSSSDLGVWIAQTLVDLDIPPLALPALLVLGLQTLNDLMALARQPVPERPVILGPGVPRDPAMTTEGES
jgi:hypothetical protein